MKSTFLYLVFFFIILFFFFVPKKELQPFEPISGIVYSATISSITLTTERLLHQELFKRKYVSDLPEYTFHTDLSLSRKFIGRVKAISEADYIIVDKNENKKEKIKKEVKKIKRKKETKEKRRVKKQEIVKKEKKEIVFNFHILKNAVKASDKSYFFSNTIDTKKQVSLIVYSITPWRNKYIINFKIVNKQDKYFFLSNISVYDTNDNYISAEFFNESLVAGDKTLSGYIILPNDVKKDLKINLVESGGHSRLFDVKFIIP